ncbi:MAG TPA: GerMN domain-containing protein [Thermoanaerobaculia bacterium]|jgi:hypothetical protein|nr:GerMN domain-containing protein [Thermoanaerobaculia bacterium]
MTRRGLAFGALLAAAALGLACQRRGSEAAAGGPAPSPGRTEKATVSLLFPGDDGFLHAEPRELVLPLEPDGRVEAVVGALLAGPKTDGLVAPLPAGVTVADAFVDGQGVAYLDLGAKDQPDPPASGSDLELLRVYSLVNTVLANEPRVRGVVLLWNGTQRPTFAGHVDTGAPLLADRRLVR